MEGGVVGILQYPPFVTCVAAAAQDVADLLREQQQQKVQLEKAMEQLIAAQTQKEHAVRKVGPGGWREGCLERVTH
jgi:hypothetical protein